MTQSNEPTIDDKNTTIAKFMGILAVPAGTIAIGKIKPPYESIAFLNYHEKWELLMPVVEKIETPELNVKGRGIIRAAADVEILYKACVITYEPDEESGDTNDAHGVAESGETKLEAVYKAVYQFIQWFNQQAVNRIDKLSAEADQTCENIKETFNKMKGRKICSNCGIDYDENESHKCPE